MRFFLTFLLLLPTLARADDHPCFAIDPHTSATQSVAACTSLLLTEDLERDIRADALAVRGVALRELGEFERSAEDLDGSIAISGDTGTMRMLAWTYREMGQYPEAENLYSRVLEADTHWQGWLSRCVVRQDMGLYQDALGDCEAALKQTPENTDVLYFTARALSMLDRPARALTLAERASALAPDDPRHRTEIAWAMYQMGQTRRAMSVAEEALLQFPGDPGLLYFLSEVR